MRIVIQRVANATLTEAATGTVVSSIQRGLMVLCGITGTDNEIDIDYLVPKILKTKLWDSGDKPWASSVVDMDF